MKQIEIKTKRQENELFGIPLNCYQLDDIIILDDKKSLLFSAILQIIDDTYKTPFKVIFKKDYGFYIDLSKNIFDDNSILFFMEYENFEVINNCLYIFDDNKEKTIFLRKHKIIKIKNE